MLSCVAVVDGEIEDISRIGQGALEHFGVRTRKFHAFSAACSSCSLAASRVGVSFDGGIAGSNVRRECLRLVVCTAADVHVVGREAVALRRDDGKALGFVAVMRIVVETHALVVVLGKLHVVRHVAVVEESRACASI